MLLTHVDPDCEVQYEVDRAEAVLCKDVKPNQEYEMKRDKGDWKPLLYIQCIYLISPIQQTYKQTRTH